jgi:hypothetical protein
MLVGDGGVPQFRNKNNNQTQPNTLV